MNSLYLGYHHTVLYHTKKISILPLANSGLSLSPLSSLRHVCRFAKSKFISNIKYITSAANFFFETQHYAITRSCQQIHPIQIKGSESSSRFAVKVQCHVLFPFPLIPLQMKLIKHPVTCRPKSNF